jgi:hypothetical protein
MLSKRCIGKVRPKEKPIIEPIVWNDANGVQIESDRWWALYDVYLQSPTWAEKRRRVFERSRGLCEGCGVRRATRVHHRRYPRGVLPGSQEWIRAEKLFDLVALCSRCHADLHPSKDGMLGGPDAIFQTPLARSSCPFGSTVVYSSLRTSERLPPPFL